MLRTFRAPIIEPKPTISNSKPIGKAKVTWAAGLAEQASYEDRLQLGPCFSDGLKIAWNHHRYFLEDFVLKDTESGLRFTISGSALAAGNVAISGAGPAY